MMRAGLRRLDIPLPAWRRMACASQIAQFLQAAQGGVQCDAEIDETGDFIDPDRLHTGDLFQDKHPAFPPDLCCEKALRLPGR